MADMQPFVDYTPTEFTGFQLGEWHSSKLGITHVSGGDRYEESLQPEINDITVSVPGMDGEYFFGSTYGTRTIDLELAFDHLTDLQLKRLRWYYGSRVIKPLIFDELPYKRYYAKIESPMEFSYVCFDEPEKVASDTPQDGVRRTGTEELFETHSLTVSAHDSGTIELRHPPKTEPVVTSSIDCTVSNNIYTFVNNTDTEVQVSVNSSYDSPTWEQVYPWVYTGNMIRVYKGEAKLSLKCIYPFARSHFKVLPQIYYDAPWESSSGILRAGAYAEFDKYINGTFKLYNPGDMQTGFRMYLPRDVAEDGTTLIYYKDGTNETNRLVLNPMTMASDAHIGVLIDTNNHLIQAVTAVSNDNYTTTSYLYNKYVDSGQFFTIRADYSKNSKMTMTNGSQDVKIYYDYLYF